MNAVAVIALVAVLGVSIWALFAAPLREMGNQFQSILKLPWGRQVIVDFYGLEAILALWMLDDASRGGNWTAAILSIVAMPVFGAMSAAAYWLLR